MLPRREAKNIEFKERLSSSVHLQEKKKQKLAAQMRERLDAGDGKAVYVLGVKDNGEILGLKEVELEESLQVLKSVAAENSACVQKVEKFEENGKLLAKIIVAKLVKPKQHVSVGVAGHVNHGKSTLVACLITGRRDEGRHWLFMDRLPHEIERNLSADLHFALLGFAKGKPICLQNPLDKKERARTVEKAERVVSFVDMVGHEPWLRSTIRGLVGEELDYSILTVACDDGVTSITKEHLGIMLAMQLPVLVCLTKADKVSGRRVEEVEQQVELMLKNVGKVPYRVRSKADIPVFLDKLGVVVPVFRTSARTLEGFELLYETLRSLPPKQKPLEKPFLMYVDKVYNVSGVGVVVSGTIKQGKLKPGKSLLLGPNSSGEFKTVKARSIQMHYSPLNEAEAGLLVGIALRGVSYEEVWRGMVLCDKELGAGARRSFEAEVLVLSHSTRISEGYEPVFHCNTISSTVKLKPLDKKYLKAGESGKVLLTFKYRPFFLQEGERFVLREARSKCIGTVTKILS